MSKPEDYIDIVHGAVVETAQRFHLRAETDDGRLIEVPMGYQILEPGFRPFRAGKASPEEIQAELDQLIADASEKGVALGVEGKESVGKLAIQNGWGVDCSNFAYHALEAIHNRLALPQYPETVFRSASDVRALHEASIKSGNPNWLAKDENGEARNLSDVEQDQLEVADCLSIDWIMKTFGKDPTFVTGSAHICAEEATVGVETDELLPGDLIAFTKAGAGVVSHVGVIEQAERVGDETQADFWHSWHSRDYESGIRRDRVIISPGQAHRWSHEGLEDPTRYEAYSFRRPAAMAVAYAQLG